MESRLYGGLAGIEALVPEGDDLGATHDAYIAMATVGRATDRQREVFFSIGRQSCQAQGVEAVVLAGTDLFLAFEGYECGFPVIDSAQVHVNALFRESLKEAPGRGRP
jgi:aspartate racemase